MLKLVVTMSRAVRLVCTLARLPKRQKRSLSAPVGSSGMTTVVEFAVGRVEEPHLAFANGPGKGNAGVTLSKVESPLFCTDGMKSVAKKRKWSSPIPVLRLRSAAGTFSEFGGVAGRFDVQRTERVGTDPVQELPARRLGDVETIQQGKGLIRFRRQRRAVVRTRPARPREQSSARCGSHGLRVGEVE